MTGNQSTSYNNYLSASSSSYDRRRRAAGTQQQQHRQMTKAAMIKAAITGKTIARMSMDVVGGVSTGVRQKSPVNPALQLQTSIIHKEMRRGFPNTVI